MANEGAVGRNDKGQFEKGHTLNVGKYNEGKFKEGHKINLGREREDMIGNKLAVGNN
jgi:hypothetical protein